MFRNIVFAIISVGMLTACSQGPDFTVPAVITQKVLYDNNKAEYHVSQENNGVRGAGAGSIIFLAPNDFAKVGETIRYKHGTLVVVRLK